ncbi:uncharacterized protein LOC119046367 isoform X2 [Artibeus jamaicensis]|uniref:uncharacterized protein LOC119046367 isoform X2 n=1 Tax=Artibeus jamaicensis TaxID=9417 RepID=UPI00235B215F|nr:uncharacterized protein LOC119046367 isoform X2 [Artibeus jamaicensis]
MHLPLSWATLCEQGPVLTREQEEATEVLRPTSTFTVSRESLRKARKRGKHLLTSYCPPGQEANLEPVKAIRNIRDKLTSLSPAPGFHRPTRDPGHQLDVTENLSGAAGALSMQLSMWLLRDPTNDEVGPA